jgi:hypothetical protein
MYFDITECEESVQSFVIHFVWRKCLDRGKKYIGFQDFEKRYDIR